MKRFLACILLIALPSIASAATIRVPEDYPSVLAGVDAAVSGDSVLVGPGTWTETDLRVVPTGVPVESTMFLRPGITVIGTAGAEATIIEAVSEFGGSLDAVAYFVDGAEPARLIGLTFTTAETGIAAVECGPLELWGCRVVDCGRPGLVSRDTSVLMDGCLVANNEFGLAPSLRRGAVSGLNVDLVIRGSRFEGNAGSGLKSDDWSSGSPSVLVEDCEFVENGDRALISIRSTSTFIERCLFLRNGKGGVNVQFGAGAIRFCTFAYDSAASSGGGVFTAASEAVIENNTFYRCYAASRGSAINRTSVDGGTRNNVIVGCTGPFGPLYLTGSGTQHPTTGCNLFFANEGSPYAGAWSSGPTDVFADPEFCDEVLLDFGLRSSSPAAPGNSACGLIGAEDVGCGPLSVESTTWGRIKGAYRAQGDSR